MGSASHPSSSIKLGLANDFLAAEQAAGKIRNLGPVSYTHLTLPTTPYV